jgi:hypothetical protein
MWLDAFIDSLPLDGGGLDRIMIYRKQSLVPINHVNPIYIDNVEPIHMVVGSLIANHPGFAVAKLRLRQGELAWAKMLIPTHHDRL